MRWQIAIGIDEEAYARRLDASTFGLDPQVRISTEFPELIETPTKTPPTSHIQRRSAHSPRSARLAIACRDLPARRGGEHTEWQQTTRNWEDPDGPQKGETEDEYDV